MRVVVYVPSASTRARRALAADTTRAGHDIAGFATTAHDATWGLHEWRADRIAGRDRDLLQLVQDQPDLSGRVLGIRPTRRAKAAVLIPAGWLAWWRRHRWTTAAAAGVAAAALVAALTIGGEDRRPDAAPAVTGSAPPSSSPPASRRPTGPPPPRVSVPPNNPQTPRTTPVRDTGTRPAPAAVEESTAPRTTPPPAPASPAPTDVAEPTPGTTTPPAAQPAARCVVDLRLIVLRVRLCLDRSAD